MLLELPTGDWVDPIVVAGIHYLNDKTYGPRIVIDTQKEVARYFLPFDDAESALGWRKDFGTKVNSALCEKIVSPHQDLTNDVHLPWNMAVDLLRLYIIDRLVRRHNMSVPDATAQTHASLTQYDPLIDQIMKDLIGLVAKHIGRMECPYNTAEAVKENDLGKSS
jgi:hypothetical protein